MKWIKTADKLPPNGLDVLVYLPNYEQYIVAYYYNGVWSDTIPKVGRFFIKPSRWAKIPH